MTASSTTGDATPASELSSYILDACINKAREAILVADMRVPGGPLCFVSDTFVTITGYSRQEAVGKNCSYLQGKDTDQPEIGLIRQAMTAGTPAEVTLRNYRKDGTLFHNRLRLEPVMDKSGALTHYIGFVRDVSELHGAQQTIEHLAHLDATTGLLNRQTFTERVSEAATADEGEVVVVKLDVVQFHDINSGYGYETGDRLLREIANRLKTTDAFAVGRMGANEFAAAFRTASSDEASRIAVATLDLVEQGYVVGEHEISVRFSSGYAFGAVDEDSPKLIRNAGTALHRSKRSQFRTVQNFSGGDETEARRRVQLTAQLRHALDKNEFVMHYQPKVDIATSRVIGAEALIRWMHPTLGMQPPGSFISHAESVGMIGEIDAQAFAMAARFCNLVNTAPGSPTPISVNVSGREITDPALVERIRDICRREGTDPRLVILELTETVMVGANGDVRQTMEALRGDGFGISIDDFGTGYSSLSYLHRFPISEIKLDRSFVTSIGSNPINRIITESVIRIGEASGFSVVAEGVETNDELSVLKQIRCPFGQGYLFGRPEDGDSFISRLQAQAS